MSDVHFLFLILIQKLFADCLIAWFPGPPETQTREPRSRLLLFSGAWILHEFRVLLF